MNAAHEDAAIPAEGTVDADPAVEQAILALIAADPKGRPISPAEAAVRVATEAQTRDRWQRFLPRVRRAAVRMAIEGRIAIYRKGRPVDPGEFRGVYRLGRPAPQGAGNSADDRPVA
ncbi:DUF3253 domain-containing protein [Ancylobacter lacus]|uniref:DUF3253 domain-containing protein n=1 Tax=Ancylobacter lacus TaxID=2579970 RepID=UPI001BCD2889|nr:DUF3253 domain-containing protein [Ancylobacter lacus]MBS7540869.1 DUF3253 domain-containing protein [Ancylobacter lacus]